MNVLANVMTSSRPHLHEPKPYMLCCKEVDLCRCVAPPTDGLHYLGLQPGGFDKTFAEDSNALNKYCLYNTPFNPLSLPPSLSGVLSTPLTLSLSLSLSQVSYLPESCLQLFRGQSGHSSGLLLRPRTHPHQRLPITATD